jgi:hypothetical protein
VKRGGGKNKMKTLKDKEKKASISVHRHVYKHVLPLLFALLFILALASSLCPTVSAHACDCHDGEKFHGTLNGGIYFEYQDVGCDAEDESVTFNNVPDKEKIKFARVYTNIWGGKPSSGGEFNITVNGHLSLTYLACDPCPQATDCYPTQKQACNTTDMPGEVHDYITGCCVHFIAYNATTNITTGSNTVTMKTHGLSTCPNATSPFDGRIYSIALLVVYEDPSMPEITYWINEGTRYLDNGSACCWDGVNFPEVSMYFNGSAYPGSVSDFKYWTSADPNGARINPELNEEPIGACDYKSGTNFQRWDNIPRSYLNTPSNLFYYYNPVASYERISVAVLMLNSSGCANLTVTDISPSGLYADPSESGRYANVINATVVNYGKTAYFFNVTLYVNDTVVDVKKVENLGEGESTNVSLLWAPNATGSYELNVTADVENVVNETDETNNSKTLDVTVTEAPPPAWQSQSSNVSTIPNGGVIELRAQGNATVGLHNATLSTNETGDWKNITDGRYGSPMDMVSYFNHSITHTSEANWNNQTIEREPVYNGKPLLIVSSGNVKLAQVTVGTENLARDKPAYAKDSVYLPGNAVDGNGGSFWESFDAVPPTNWWKVDLGGVTDIVKIDIQRTNDAWKYDVLTSNDNETWTTRITKGFGYPETFSNLDWSCQYINITVYELFGGYNYATITEFEAYGLGDYAPNGTLTSSTIETSNPVVAVIPTWDSTEPAGTNLLVNVSVDNGATWKPATSGTELTWDYDVYNTKLKYKVLFETTDVNETSVLHDITLNYTIRDPLEGEWLWSNFTWHNASVTDTTVGWKIYYEDMLGQTNCTAEETFKVGETTVDTSFTVTLPSGCTYAIFEPANSTATNVSPGGQTPSTAFYNVTNTGTVSLSIRMQLNATVSNILLKAGTDNDSGGAKEVNTTLVTIFSPLEQDYSVNIWIWSDFSHAIEQQTNKTLSINVTQA